MIQIGISVVVGLFFGCENSLKSLVRFYFVLSTNKINI